MKRIWVVTLFPDYFLPLKEFGVVGQALRNERGAEFELKFINPAEQSSKKFKGVDDSPYGGGPGMVMRADILKQSLEAIVEHGEYGEDYRNKLKVIYPSPRGKVWNSDNCQDFASSYLEGEYDLVFICGRYEGIDQRFIDLYVDLEVSIGDYVLSGGEIAVMAILDSALRFVPGVLGNRSGTAEESFMEGQLEYSHYTRPAVFEGREVPEILLSGNHGKIAKYREQMKAEETSQRRPDMVDRT